MSTENRIYPRYLFVDGVIIVTDTEQQLIMESENISTGGMFLVTDDHLPVGTPGFLKMQVGLSDMKKEINAKFVVRHIRQSDSGGEGMGVEFTYMPDDEKALLEALIGQISEK